MLAANGMRKNITLHLVLCSARRKPYTEFLDNSPPIPDHGIMRRIGEVISAGFKQIGQIMRIRNAWHEIAGEVLSAHAEPVVVKNKVLHVICDSPAWAQQIGILSPTLASQIKKLVGIHVEKVEGKFGMAAKTPKRQKSPRVCRKPEIDPEDVNRVKDPELAKAIRTLIESEGTGNG